MSSTASGMRGGQPSTTTPTPPPWDSPKVAMRKIVPSWLDMSAARISTWPHATQQHVAGAGAAVARQRAHEGHHARRERRAREPADHAVAQHRAALGVEAAAVDHEHAAHAVLRGPRERALELAPRLGGPEAVEVDAQLARPVAAPQPREVLAVDAAREAREALSALLDLEAGRLRHAPL